MTADPKDPGYDAEFVARWWPEPTVREPTAPPAPPGHADPYAAKAFEAELEDLARTAPGGRNHRLNVAAFNLGQLVGSGHLNATDVAEALFRVGVATGLEAGEVRGTIRSGMEAGELSPRHVDETFRTEDYPEVTVLGPDPGADPGGDDDGLGLIDWEALWADETQEEWIIEPLIPARRLVALFSPPKIGKSLLMLELAVAISRGDPALGKIPDRPRRVLYVDFENDPRGDVRTRLEAMGRKPADLADLCYLSFPRLPHLDTAMGGMVLLGAVTRHGCEVVVIDTVSRAVGGEENANDTWLNFYRHTGLALKAAGVACIRLDHTGKDETRGMRGGSAKYGDVDAVWSMTVVGQDLQLECTANRLPVTDKVLVLERQADPLRHELRGGGPLAARDAVHAACIKAMRELGATAGISQRDAKALLADADLFPKDRTRPGSEKRFSDREVEGAVSAWNSTPTTYVDARSRAAGDDR